MKKHEFAMDFRCQNERSGMVKVMLVHHACCNLRGSGGSRKLMKNGYPNSIKKAYKSNPLAPMVGFFEILRGFEKTFIFVMF